MVSVWRKRNMDQDSGWDGTKKSSDEKTSSILSHFIPWYKLYSKKMFSSLELASMTCLVERLSSSLSASTSASLFAI